MKALRVRTGIARAIDGRWRVVLEIAGVKHFSNTAFATEADAETAANKFAETVRAYFAERGIKIEAAS